MNIGNISQLHTVFISINLLESPSFQRILLLYLLLHNNYYIMIIHLLQISNNKHLTVKLNWLFSLLSTEFTIYICRLEGVRGNRFICSSHSPLQYGKDKKEPFALSLTHSSFSLTPPPIVYRLPFLDSRIPESKSKWFNIPLLRFASCCSSHYHTTFKFGLKKSVVSAMF